MSTGSHLWTDLEYFYSGCLVREEHVEFPISPHPNGDIVSAHLDASHCGDLWLGVSASLEADDITFGEFVA